MSANPRDVGPTLDPEDPTGPGSQLREARHRANLSVEEVATQLRLDRRTVRALEEGDFQHLPAPTFIRGYIRSYARLLGLPPGPILEAYDFQGFTPPAILADISQRPQARVSDIPVRLATYLVAAGLVLMVVMWWHSRESAPPPGAEPVAAGPADAAAPDSPAAGPRNPPVSAALDPPQEPALPQAAATDPADTKSSGPPGPAPQGSESVRVAAPPTPSPSGLDESPGMSARRTASDATGTQAAAGDTAVPGDGGARVADGSAPATPGEPAPAQPRIAAVPDAPEPEPAPGTSSRLNLHFEQESWVEVYDADGIRHVFELATAGDDIDARGEAPFNVLLGYAEGATVTFEGRQYDIGRYIRGNTARFLIGPNGLAKAPPPPERTPAPEEPQTAESEPAAGIVPGTQN